MVEEICIPEGDLVYFMQHRIVCVAEACTYVCLSMHHHKGKAFVVGMVCVIVPVL